MTRAKIILILGILAAILWAMAVLSNQCLPDTPDRFYMGRGNNGQCLYQNTNTGEVYQ